MKKYCIYDPSKVVEGNHYKAGFILRKKDIEEIKVPIRNGYVNKLIHKPFVQTTYEFGIDVCNQLNDLYLETIISKSQR